MASSSETVTTVEVNVPESVYAHRMQHIWCVISEEKKSATDRYRKLTGLLHDWHLADVAQAGKEGGRGVKRAHVESEPPQSSAVSIAGSAELFAAPEPAASSKMDIIAANRAKALAKREAKRQEELAVFEGMQWLW